MAGPEGVVSFLKRSNDEGLFWQGSSGTRVNPLTKVTSKQLLALYDKPMIFYVRQAGAFLLPYRIKAAVVKAHRFRWLHFAEANNSMKRRDTNHGRSCGFCGKRVASASPPTCLLAYVGECCFRDGKAAV